MRTQPRISPFWTGLGAAALLAVAMIGVVISGIPGGPAVSWPWSRVMTLRVQLSSSDALQPHAGVDLAGVKIGEVRSVAADGDLAVATLQIDPAYGDIHTDAQVYLRPHGLFGPKYIELTAGTTSAPVVRDGGTLGVGNSVQPVDLDQVLRALDAPEAKNLRTALVELGKAAAGRGDDVNRLLQAADTISRSLQTPLRTLDSVAPSLDDFLVKNEAFNADFATTPLDQLVANSNLTLRAFADNSAQLESLLQHADTTLTSLDSALSGQSGSIHQAISSLPGVVDKLTRFNKLLALFGANLTGKDTTVPGNTDVTSGIISAIENPRSAFASYDPCYVPPGSPPTTNNCTPGQKQFYLRVEAFNVGSSGQALSQLCGLPVPGLPGVTLPACPASASSAGASSRLAGYPAPDMAAGSYLLLSGLIPS